MPAKARRPRQVQPGLLQGRRHRRRRRMGLLAARRAVLCVVYPRLPARPRLGQRRRRRLGEIERAGIRKTKTNHKDTEDTEKNAIGVFFVSFVPFVVRFLLSTWESFMRFLRSW